jgi:hypothetical protein
MGTPVAMPDPDTVASLLDCDDPSARYFALTLLGESADGVAAAKTWCLIMTKGPVPLILAAQREKSYRCERERFYTAITTGTVWQFIILAQLGADGYAVPARSSCATPRTPSPALAEAATGGPTGSRTGRRHRFGVWSIDS